MDPLLIFGPVSTLAAGILGALIQKYGLPSFSNKIFTRVLDGKAQLLKIPGQNKLIGGTIKNYDLSSMTITISPKPRNQKGRTIKMKGIITIHYPDDSVESGTIDGIGNFFGEADKKLFRGTAFLFYTVEENNTGFSWRGQTILYIPSADDIVGYWLSEEPEAGKGHFAFGSTNFSRKSNKEN